VLKKKKAFLKKVRTVQKSLTQFRRVQKNSEEFNTVQKSSDEFRRVSEGFQKSPEQCRVV
jgi:hypothetical protein